jgi:putative membrane protein
MPPRYLDKKIKLIWFLPALSVIIFLNLIFSFFVLFLSSEPTLFSLDKKFVVFVFFLFTMIFIALPWYLWTHLEYISFTYELAENELIIRYGILTRHTIVIPYVRIQNINSTRTIIERLLGLATLQIETAGTNVGASEAYLPGITKKDLLIKEIMQRVEQAKENEEKKEKFNNNTDIFNSIHQELIKINKNLEKVLEKEKVFKEDKFNKDFKHLK